MDETAKRITKRMSPKENGKRRKEEYDAKGTGYLDAGGGLESMSDTELIMAISLMM